MGLGQLAVHFPEDSSQYKELMDLAVTHGDLFRTFKHGALHGGITGLLIALPVIVVGGLFEHKTWRHMLIGGGYWIVAMALMGGVICQFL